MAPLLSTRLEGLRAKMRARLFVAGALRLGAEAGAFLVLQFCADRMLDLPVAARRSVLLAAALLFAWRFIVLIGRPLGRRIVAMDMALAVERRHPELDGALASMVEFERATEFPADVSPSLLEQWRGEVEAKSVALDFSAIFDARLLKRLLLADLGLALVVGGFVATHAAEARIFLARLFGAEMDWPRRTHLLLDDVAGDSPHFRVERDGSGRATSVLIARGASLPVDVAARGTVPDEVLLVIRESGRDGKEEVRLSPKEGAAGEFVYRFKNVVRAMELNAEGGDDPGNGAPLLVRVAPAPAVEKLVATVTPPAYTRRSPTREERQEFAVPAGTRLDLDVRTLGDVTEGTLTMHSDPGTAKPLERDATDPTLWRASLVAEDTGT